MNLSHKFMKNSSLTHLALLISLATPAMAQLTAVEEAVVEKKVVVEPLTPPVIIQGSLADLVNDSATFTTLKAALIATGLDLTLGAKEVFTLFAPTDEAFSKLPPGTLAKLMMPENKEKLRQLLLYHVVPGKLLAAELKDGDLITMNGEKVKIDVEDDKIEIDETKLFSSDVMAANGVMHSVGKVLVPKSLDDFAGLDR
jgi:uncharacterized surface protein with fasciclin (FAS1) repeats